MLALLSIGVSEHRVFSRWNLIGKLHILCDCSLSLLDRTFQIHIRNLLAQICLCIDESNQPILDLQYNISILLNIF